MNTARLAVTAAFAHGMPNFTTDAPEPPYDGDVAVYHAMPHGLCDRLRRPVVPELFAETTCVQAVKRRALAAHASQKAWLDVSHGMDSYLDSGDAAARAVGRISGRFEYAEGWRRHLHLGLPARDGDPLGAALGARQRSVATLRCDRVCLDQVCLDQVCLIEKPALRIERL